MADKCVELVAQALREGDAKFARLLAYECAKLRKAKKEVELAKAVSLALKVKLRKAKPPDFSIL